MAETAAADTAIVAALAGWAAALKSGDRATALVAAQRAMELARSANSPYVAVTVACVEHTGGLAAEVYHQARSCSCSFCGAGEDVARLIAGPDVFICEACIGVGRGQKLQQPPAGDGTARPCSFCTQQPTESAPAVVTADHSICGKCVRLCAAIFSGGNA